MELHGVCVEHELCQLVLIVKDHNQQMVCISFGNSNLEHIVVNLFERLGSCLIQAYVRTATAQLKNGDFRLADQRKRVEVGDAFEAEYGLFELDCKDILV